jgi:hypothetical protein
MEKKPSGRKHHEEVHHTIPSVAPALHIEPDPDIEKKVLHPTPEGYKVWQLIAVSTHNQHMIFSDDGEHWFNFDGTTHV